MQRIIRRAGLMPWVKLWHNLRATRQTELANQYPLHVVCAWIGNSRAVAQEHYLQVTDSHFAQATTAGKSVSQNLSQNVSETVRNDKGMVKPEMQKRPENGAFLTNSDTCRNIKYPQGESNPCMQTENLPS